jgi:hypothetical protein
VVRLADIMVYICKYYPYKSELSKARLTKLIYLADWKYALSKSTQISPIRWYFDRYGPFVYDVLDEAKDDSRFRVEKSETMYGSEKEVIRLIDEDVDALGLATDEIETLDFVINKTKDKNWSEFLRLVYSTYPIATQSKFSNLDLSVLAEEYKEKRDQGLFDDQGPGSGS